MGTGEFVENLTNCRRVTCNGLASRPGGIEILPAAYFMLQISSGSYIHEPDGSKALLLLTTDTRGFPIVIVIVIARIGHSPWGFSGPILQCFLRLLGEIELVLTLPLDFQVTLNLGEIAALTPIPDLQTSKTIHTDYLY